MASPSTRNPADTYPVRAVARLTGLSPEVLRAWERRHQAVSPFRTEGGTRRYRAEDVRRLRLLKRAVEAGGRIGRLAKLPSEELERILGREPTPARPALDDVLRALAALDVNTTQGLLGQMFAALGARRFAADVACPLLREIGARWERGELSVASEHLGTSVLRSILGPALQHGRAPSGGVPMLFATPSGERHELGLLTAAITAASAGAKATYLGSDLPAPEVIAAARQTRARIVALSIVCLDLEEAATALVQIREQIDARVEIWVGGPRAQMIGVEGVDSLLGLEALESRISLRLASEISS